MKLQPLLLAPVLWSDLSLQCLSEVDEQNAQHISLCDHRHRLWQIIDQLAKEHAVQVA